MEHRPMFLSKDELMQLSDCASKARIADFLQNNGFKFILSADGWPKVLREHVNDIMGGHQMKARKKLDFSDSKWFG